MNKKLLIALGILVVLVVGLISLDCQRIAKQGLIQWIMKEPDSVVKFGENTVYLTSVGVYKLTPLSGCYHVRFKGYIYVTSGESYPWWAGFRYSYIPGRYVERRVTSCNPGQAKYYTYDDCVACGMNHWWRTMAWRIDYGETIYGPYGPGYYSSCP